MTIAVVVTNLQADMKKQAPVSLGSSKSLSERSEQGRD